MPLQYAPRHHAGMPRHHVRPVASTNLVGCCRAYPKMLNSAFRNGAYMNDLPTPAGGFLGITNTKPNQFWLGTFIFLAIAVSIGTAVSLGDVLRFPDEREYMSIARNLVDFGAYSIDENAPTAFRTPTWPLLLAVGNLISHNVIWLRLINLALHLGASLLLLRFTRRLGFPFPAALITSVGYFFSPILFFTATTFYPQTLCAFLVALMLNIMLVDSVWTAGALGVLTSVAALAVPGTVLALCLFAFFQCYQFSLRAMLLRLVVFGLAAALTLTPWITRNYLTFAAFIPLSTDGGRNILKGNSAGAPLDGNSEVHIESYLERVAGLSDHEADKKLQIFAFEWIQANKREAAFFYLRKFLNWFNYWNSLGTKGEETTLRRIVAFLAYYSVLIAAFVGSSIWSKSARQESNPIAFWLWLIYIVAGLSYAIVFTRVRYRVPFEIILFILATPFVARLTNWFSGIRHATKETEASCKP
jgi:hypothetical protein